MAPLLRPATPADAPAIAHIQVETWRTTYTGIVPETFLSSLSVEALAAKWQLWTADPQLVVLVAEAAGSPEAPARLIGFISGGPLREPLAAFDAELYALYILHPEQRLGTGLALTEALARTLLARGLRSLLVWVLEQNPATHFYSRLGAVLAARKLILIGDADLPELAFGWEDMAQLSRTHAT